MDFLAYVSVSKDANQNNYLVLNSVSMVQKAIHYIQNYNEKNYYKKIELFLDNDKA
ncbi:MAG: toprim domain-containing protein [Campylobacterota bacterium]|nr:toprim domain-containing protein [Campylobacterota bacterium]